MNRIFGSSKAKPKASLNDAISSVSCSAHLVVCATECSLRRVQTENRMGAIEVKIKKLDAELLKYREQMSKLRNGPGRVSNV